MLLRIKKRENEPIRWLDKAIKSDQAVAIACFILFFWGQFLLRIRQMHHALKYCNKNVNQAWDFAPNKDLIEEVFRDVSDWIFFSIFQSVSAGIHTKGIDHQRQLTNWSANKLEVKALSSKLALPGFC